jgi:hypothetical protein
VQLQAVSLLLGEGVRALPVLLLCHFLAQLALALQRNCDTVGQHEGGVGCQHSRIALIEGVAVLQELVCNLSLFSKCCIILMFATLYPAGTFLRGVLDKVGVEPQVQRIGAYKSAGDQLLRRDMSDAQREQLGELLDDIYENFLDTVAEARGKTREVGLSGCVVGKFADGCRQKAQVGSNVMTLPLAMCLLFAKSDTCDVCVLM